MKAGQKRSSIDPSVYRAEDNSRPSPLIIFTFIPRIFNNSLHSEFTGHERALGIARPWSGERATDFKRSSSASDVSASLVRIRYRATAVVGETPQSAQHVGIYAEKHSQILLHPGPNFSMHL